MAIEGRPDECDARATVRAALEAGARVIDTADVYGRTGEPPGYAERLLRSLPDDALVATKGGLVREPNGTRRVCGDPVYLRAACEASIRRMQVAAIDIYQLHRADPRVPFEDSVGALLELAERGLVRAIGVCNASAHQIDAAARICGPRLVSVQNRLDPAAGVDPDVLGACDRAGLAFLGYAVFGGVDGAASLPERWPDAARVAAAHGVSVHRVVVARALACAPAVVPIVGARRPASIVDSVAARDLVLTEYDLKLLSRCPAP